MRGKLGLLAVFFCLSAFGADYRSSGFQANLSRQGNFTSLMFRGERICSSGQLQGSALTAPGGPKKNLKFRRSRSGTVKEERSAEATLLRYSGTFDCGETPDAADYRIEMRLAPERIRIRTRILLKKDVYSHSHLFSWEFLIPVSGMNGRGIRFFRSEGDFTDLLLPEVFERRIKLIGRKVYLAYPTEVIGFENVQNATVRFEDNRNWAKKNFHVFVHPDSRWNNLAQKISAGTVFEWVFDILLYNPPESDEEL